MIEFVEKTGKTAIEDSPRRVMVKAFGHVFVALKDPCVPEAWLDMDRERAWGEMGKMLADWLRERYENGMREAGR